MRSTAPQSQQPAEISQSTKTSLVDILAADSGIRSAGGQSSVTLLALGIYARSGKFLLDLSISELPTDCRYLNVLKTC